VDREAAPAAADVQEALPGLEGELLADKLKLRVLGLFQRLGPAREEGAAVGHPRVEEEREELGGEVVVVANGPGVAPAAMATPLRPQLGSRDRGRKPRPAGPRGGHGEAGLCGPVESGWVPAAEELEHGVEVVHLELAGHIGATEPELARRSQRVRERGR
jgi:hypothetical protein